MPKRYLVLLTLLLLTGCWSSEEIDNTALAHGIGMDKVGDKIKISLEIIKPSPLGEGQGQESGTHIILEQEVDTPLTGVRAMIRTAKRRLHFEHARVWIIGEELAKADLIDQLDVVRRERMLRISSNLFVTKNDPADVLSTPTLYEHLTSLELSEAMDETKYTTGFITVNAYDFFAQLEGALPTAHLPMIVIQRTKNKLNTAFDGTAVFNHGKMVGQLTINETIGLNWLLNQVKGGSITIELATGQKGAIRIKNPKTKIKPKLEGNHLQVEVLIHLDGDFVDNPLDKEMDEPLMNDIKKRVNQKVESDVRTALKKLQGELKTDITEIGLATYRKYPQRWAELYPVWDDIFANADITIDVQVNILNTGKINKNLKRDRKKPANNPFKFNKQSS